MLRRINRLSSFDGIAYKGMIFLGRPEPQFRTVLCFDPDVFFFRHAFSEIPRPIAPKLCHMIGLGGRQKRPKFGAISDNFRL